MKYYSQITKKLYQTEDALKEAETEATKAKSDRAEKAKEVTEALKAANEASKKANQMLSDFIKEYGSFKTTFKEDDIGTRRDFWNLMDLLF